MKKFLRAPHTLKNLSAIIAIMLCSCFIANAQFDYGTGNVSGNPTAPLITYTGNNATISTSGVIPAGTYNFANLTINAGVTVSVSGGSGPLILRCTGTATINGAIRSDGGNGTKGDGSFSGGVGGLGGAGGGGWGGAGGGGGNYGGILNGTDGVSFGSSSGGGKGGSGDNTSSPNSTGGGAGGGYKIAGTNGTAGQGSTPGGIGGLVYGDALLTTVMTQSAITTNLLGGSGGGGGGERGFITKHGGGGGGGGGGAIGLTANTIVFATAGFLSVKGGAGAQSVNYGGAYGGSGGGGSGGTIHIQYNTALTGFVLDVNDSIQGGKGATAPGSIGGAAGNGGEGRILVEQDGNLGCSGTPAAGTITASSLTVCPNSTDTLSIAGFPAASGYKFQWQSATTINGTYTNITGGTGDTTDTYVTAALTATAYYKCIITCRNSGQSSTTAAITITVSNLPTPTVTSNSPVCAGTTLTLDASDIQGATFNWTGPATYNNQQHPTKPNATTADSGTYTVIASIGSCQSAPVTVQVIVSPAPVLAGNVTYTTPACTGANLQLNAPTLAGVTYNWTGPNTFADTVQNPVRTNITLGDSGDYVVTGKVGACTSAPVTVHVSVNETPAAPTLTSSANIICSSDSTQVCAPDNFTAYKWNNGPITNCTYAKQAGGYWVTVTAANGCSVISSRANIAVYPVSSVSIIVQGDTLASFGASAYQWYRNDIEIPGATSNIYITTQTGSYSVRITDSNGCQATSSPVSVAVGINELPVTGNFEIYPNPASSLIHIQYTGIGDSKMQVAIYNVLGDKLKGELLNVNTGKDITLDVSAFAKGIYLVQLQQAGKLPTTRKIVVQ